MSWDHVADGSKQMLAQRFQNSMDIREGNKDLKTQVSRGN